MRVAVVVDDEWRRRGVDAGIRTLGGFLACVWVGRPSEVGQLADIRPELALVDIGVTTGWDRLGGLAAVAALTRMRSATSVGTVVAVAEDLSNPLLAVRAAEVDADFLCSWEEVDDLVSLERILLTPPIEWAPGRRMDFPALRALGVSPTGWLGAGLEHLECEGLASALDRSEGIVLSRRRMITLRRTLADLMGVRPVGAATASQNQLTAPSWQQLLLIINLARGARVGA